MPEACWRSCNRVARYLTITIALGLSLSGCASLDESSPRPEVEQWGTLREALRDGESQGRVQVADVARRDVYAVGALADLEGEVTIHDGEVWMTRAIDGTRVETRHDAGDASATVLFASTVPRWLEVTIDEDVDASELDAFLARAARSKGIDLDAPFVFTIDGPLQHLGLHVLAGDCPMRARMLGRAPDPPPFEKHLDAVSGTLVGIYSAQGAGVMTHAGSATHVHAIVREGDPFTGHVERVELKAGEVLRLPASGLMPK